MSETLINRPSKYLGISKQISQKSCLLSFSPLFAHSCQRLSADVPTKRPCHQAEWHQQRQPGRRRRQQHTALTGMSTEMQLRPLTAYSFWRYVLRGKSFNRPDFKYFSNLPNHICFPKWGVLMFKQNIRTTWTNFTERSGEFHLTQHWPLQWSPDMSTCGWTTLQLWSDWRDFLTKFLVIYYDIRFLCYHKLWLVLNTHTHIHLYFLKNKKIKTYNYLQ